MLNVFSEKKEVKNTRFSSHNDSTETVSMYGNVGLSIQTEISQQLLGCVTLEYGSNIHGAQRVNPSVFDPNLSHKQVFHLSINV